ncbi:MAG: hypothetical protein K2N87_17465 [Eubacterium sp.]|nr:hypothetical protein [Eubacterium sp.]
MDRLYKLYDEIALAEEKLSAVQARIQNIQQQKICLLMTKRKNLSAVLLKYRELVNREKLQRVELTG